MLGPLIKKSQKTHSKKIEEMYHILRKQRDINIDEIIQYENEREPSVYTVYDQIPRKNKRAMPYKCISGFRFD